MHTCVPPSRVPCSRDGDGFQTYSADISPVRTCGNTRPSTSPCAAGIASISSLTPSFFPRAQRLVDVSTSSCSERRKSATVWLSDGR